MKSYSYILVCIIALNACVSNTNNKYKESSSLDSTNQDISNSQFLKAEGFGKTKDDARRNAKDELAQIFELEIKSTLKHSTHAIINNSKEDVLEKINKMIEFYSCVKLTGVSVIDSGFNNGFYKAIAFLNKSKARDNWLAEISNCDEIIFAEFKNLKKVKSKVLHIKPIQIIWNNYMKRQSIVSRLTVIGFPAPFEKYQIKNIYNMIPDLRNNLKIFINVKGNQSKFLTSTIGNELTKEGFILTESYSNADAIISGNLSIEPVKLSSKDWKYSRAKVSIKIKDKSTGLIMGNFIKSLRRGHLTYEEAKLKAVRVISKSISQEVIFIFDPLSLTKD